ncbi:MAG TPA: YceI family protein [Candidatus Acidoferrum sp.]|nr:YceI family protein [Candidatus Acidoferrum sp.]
MGQILSRIAVTAGLAAALALPAAAATSTWSIDPAHSSAQFAVKHLSISTVRGAFTSVKGTVQFDDKDISKSTVDVTIDVASVDTRVPDRDKDLRSDHFFDADHFPTITFKSRKVEQVSPGKLKVTGDLTIHGVTKEAVLDVDGPSAPIKDPWGNQRIGINASTTINRKDFSVGNYPATIVGEDISITIDSEMVQKAAK